MSLVITTRVLKVVSLVCQCDISSEFYDERSKEENFPVKETKPDAPLQEIYIWSGHHTAA